MNGRFAWTYLRSFQHMSHAAARGEWSESAAKKWGRERVLAAQV
jgi:hypothetical protein